MRENKYIFTYNDYIILYITIYTQHVKYCMTKYIDNIFYNIN